MNESVKEANRRQMNESVKEANPERCGLNDLNSWTEEEVERKREGLLAIVHIQGHLGCQALHTD